MAGNSEDNQGDRGVGEIRPILITDEMKRSYLEYAMSVIVSRALPDIRDGLKPVHRRILYSMHEAGYQWNKPYRKSARIVGDVIGKYHPTAINRSTTRLCAWCKTFRCGFPSSTVRVISVLSTATLRPLCDIPKCALRRFPTTLLQDLENDTVDFQDNYDNSEREPTVLPARFPNLLVNGAGGIAVGMATNIPPHNLGEVIDACFAYLETPNITVEQLMEHVPGPDFPTGGVIMGRAGLEPPILEGAALSLFAAKFTSKRSGRIATR